MNTNINSVNYTSYGIPYSRMCGRIIAYQFGHPEGFNSEVRTLDVAYIDGISVTYGHPRNHIWTFAAVSENVGNCPCITCRTTTPSFVVGANFCEVGISNNGLILLPAIHYGMVRAVLPALAVAVEILDLHGSVSS